MHFRITDLKADSNPNETLDALIALFEDRYGPKIITSGVKNAIKEKSHRTGEAIIMIAKDDNNHVVGGSFTLAHISKTAKELPAASVYLYEADNLSPLQLEKSRTIRKALFLETQKAADVKGQTAMFTEGKNTVLEMKDNQDRGFRVLHFNLGGGRPDRFVWDGDMRFWMAQDKFKDSNKPKGLENLAVTSDEMQSAVYLRKNFEVLSREPEAIRTRLDMPLDQQIPKDLKEGYKVTQAIAHITDKVAENGNMFFAENFRPFVTRYGR
jgi:hypothetical protein